MNEVAATPKLRFERDKLHIHFPSLFGIGEECQCRRFVRRAFAFPEVRSIGLEPGAGQAVVCYRLDAGERKAFLQKLAEAIGGSDEGLIDESLPRWPAGESVALHRFEDHLSLFEIVRIGPGRLQLRHPAIGRDAALRRRLEETASTLGGVTKASTSASTGKLWLRYQPETVDVLRLIRLAEAQLNSPCMALATVDATPTKLGFANATLGLAALGEFAVPVVLPVCVGMLVVSNLGTIRDAGKQMRQGKVGLPVLYTALLGCSITTGQIVAHALMEWSFRFWERRSNTALAENCRYLLEDNLPIPAKARLVRSDEVEALVRSEDLQIGDRIRIEAPSAVPVDGRVVAGSALVEQLVVSGTRAPKRLVFADPVLAGSTLLAGSIEVEVTHTGAATQAAQIACSVINSARGLSHDPLLRRQAEAMADRAVPPTLALAALGWTVGGLFTVGAVMHQDHASGPQLAIPLETLRDIGLALRIGVVPRTASALRRLGESRFVVLDDHPAWSAPTLELAELHSRLAESETDNLLRYVAGACLYLGDERALALADACQARGLVVRQPPLAELDADKIVVRQGAHTIVLRDKPGTGRKKAVAPALAVEIDGEQVGVLNFRAGEQPRAAVAVQQLRRQGMQVFLLSSRPAEETERLAQRLGADLHGGDFTAEEKIRFLQGLRRRGVLATYVGNGQLDAQLAGEAHVAVSLGAAALADEASDIVVLGDTLDAFASTAGLAYNQNGRMHATCRQALLPNVLCIVGGYTGVLNGITSGLIANVGVNRVYRQAIRSLHDPQRPANVLRISR